MDIKEAMRNVKRQKAEMDHTQGLIAQVALVTHDVAESYLETSLINRKTKPKLVARYARDMLAGNWALNGESVIFSKDGNLIQGHHRMNAVIEAAKARPDIAVPMVVVRGVESAAFDTLDQGSKRSVSDVLYIRGEPFNVVLGAILRGIGVIEQRGDVKASFSVKEIEECLARHPRARYWARAVVNSGLNKLMPSVIGSVLTVAETKHSSAEIQRFFDKLASGANLQYDDPAFVLRKRFVEGKIGAKRIHIGAALHYMVTAWNHHANDKPLGRLLYREDSEFPGVK